MNTALIRTALIRGDLTAQLRALDQARTADFVRFVGRRLEEMPEWNTDPFRTTWARLLAEYADLAAVRENEADDVRL